MLLICLSLILFNFVAGESTEEGLTFQLNPGCGQKCSGTKYNILYANTSSSRESFHYICYVAPNLDYPTLLLVKSNDVNSTLEVDWNKYLNSTLHGKDIFDSVHLSGSYKASSVIVLKNLYAYNDTVDNVNMNDPANKVLEKFLLKDLKWDVSLTDNESAILFRVFDLGSSYYSQPESKIEIFFKPHTRLERNASPPKLLFSNTSAELSFTFNGLNFSEPRTRLALEISLLEPRQYNSSEYQLNNQTIDLTSSRSVNDEFSPTIFRTNQIKWKGFKDEKRSELDEINFLRWKTYGYTSRTDNSQNFITDAVASDLTAASVADIQQNRLLSGYFSSEIISKDTTIMFGKSGDGFYSSTKYFKLTTIVGFGLAPVDGFSILAVSIILFGLGIPLLILVGGCLSLGIQKHRKSRAMVTLNTKEIDSEPLIN